MVAERVHAALAAHPLPGIEPALVLFTVLLLMVAVCGFLYRNFRRNHWL